MAKIRKFKFKKNFVSITRPDIKYLKNQEVIIKTPDEFNLFMNDFKDRAGVFVTYCKEINKKDKIKKWLK